MLDSMQDSSDTPSSLSTPSNPTSQTPTSQTPMPQAPTTSSGQTTLLEHPDLTWRDDGQPVANDFDDPYFSVENGLEESRYVFLHNNGLPQRWQQWQGPFCITETGFGTGLNFLMAWQSFRQNAHPDCWLHFTSIEKFPMSLTQLQQAAALWPELADLYDKLLQQYPQPTAGFHSLCWPEERVQLTLVLADVHDALPQLHGPVHAWFLDGFAPSRNPDMWQQPLFDHIRRLSNHGQGFLDQDEHTETHQTTLATFTAAGIVRRGLKGAGFKVSKVPGYGRKREMLSAYYHRTTGPERPAHFSKTPWLHWQRSTSAANTHSQTAIVIGAGLAGCTTARALAERGLQVQLLDKDGIAEGASGNPQGGVYIKLAANDQATHTDFYLAAYQTSLKWMSRLLSSDEWRPCGVLQLGWSEKEASRQCNFLNKVSYPDSLIKPLTQQQASAQADCEMAAGGLFFEQAGWASPAAFCKALVQHPNIHFQTATVSQIVREESQWQVQLNDGRTLNADHVVVATANSTRSLLPNNHLPTKSIRGQLSYLSAEHTPALNTVLCGRSYMAPPHNQRLVLGATYNLNDDEQQLRDADHSTNLGYLADFGPAWKTLSEAALKDPEVRNKLLIGGRVGFRCTTPDYLPIAGPVVMDQSFFDSYQPMVKNAKTVPPQPAPVHTGLWVNLGHGSRGLCSAPLCAEVLAAEITGSSLPVSKTVREAILPSRFLLRDMVRRKVSRDELSDIVSGG